jgi:DNA-directed RNA polymerase II subunit RPB2
MGVNAIVAIMMYTGNNQEDSLIMNKAFVERGGFRSTYFSVHSAEEKSMGADTECFENPNSSPLCIGRKQADYSKLDNVGTVSVGATITDGTAIIGKTMSTPKFHTGRRVTVKRDRSVIFEGAEDEKCIVDQVMITTNREGLLSQRVRVRTTRTPIVGDKFSSRHGQVRAWVVVVGRPALTCVCVRVFRKAPWESCSRRRTCRFRWRRGSRRTSSSTRARSRRG